MKTRIPLGSRENLHLEFKAREALREPSSIGREAVALLNAEGGHIWIGLEEKEGCAVAVQEIPEPDREAGKLQNHLMDTIEPSPLTDELEVQVHPEKGLLWVRVCPRRERKPYALLKDRGRHYVVRVKDRTRLMSRDEIREAWQAVPPSGTTAGDPLTGAQERVMKEREKYRKRGASLLWLCIQPVEEVDLDIQDPGLKDIMCDPRLTENRQSGWNFTHPLGKSRLGKEKLIGGDQEFRYTEIRRDGGLRFTVPLEYLHWKGEEKDLWPFCLLEYPVSLFRLARTLYGRVSGPREDEVMGDLALFHVTGWTLRPYSADDPFGIGYWSREPVSYAEDKDLLWEEPLVFRWKEVMDEPDRCAYRLIRRVYEAFGHDEEKIPREFDRKSGRLILPE